MILQLTNREFQELRKFIIALENPSVTKSFNEIFSKEISGGIKGFVNPLTKDIIIEIPEGLSYEVEKVFVSYAPTLGNLIHSGASITSAPKWLSTLKGILNNIKYVISKR